MDVAGKGEGSDTLLVVDGLSAQVTGDELRKAFANFGEVAWAEIVKDYFGKSLAFGYVWMRRMQDAEVARNALHGSTVQGHEIHVETIPLSNPTEPEAPH
jgi:RNA recognition motif-containing protein